MPGAIRFKQLPQSTNNMKLTPIARIEKPSIEEFQHEFVMQDKPVIISGVANEWTAYSLWKPETFKELFGNVLAPLRATDNEIDVIFGEFTQKKIVSIAEYIDLISSIPPNGKRPPYLGNVSFNEPQAKPHLDRIRSHFDFPNYFPENSGNEIRLWIGAANQKSTIHNDNYHNFNAQIFGKKAFLLFPPEQHERLYAVKIDDELWSSPIDPQQPDLDKFPLFSKARGSEAILDEGDILFIPAFWWHQARAMTTCININMWVFTQKISQLWNEKHPAFGKSVTNCK